MKYLWIVAAMFSFCSCGTSCSKDNVQDEEEGGGTTTSNKQNIYYADPTIFLDNGTYYMSGTSQTGSHSLRGFTILMSDDLQEWRSGTTETYRFILGPEWGTTFGTQHFWAPQWYKEDGTYYFLYTANEYIAIAKADALTGIFTQDNVGQIDPSIKNIDPFLFKDDDGKYYLYHVRSSGGNFLWIAELDLETGTINPETLVKCMELTEPWERMFNYDSSMIMEGPTLMKWDDVYYLFYSANHYKDPDYAVGYATASSPTGPWTKYPGNPIIRRDIVGENGAGHGDVFEGKDGKFYYVYHVWDDDPDARQTRIIPLIREKGADGIYKISADSENIITPYQVY